MSIEIPVDINVTKVQQKLQALGLQTQAINKSVDTGQVKLLQLYTYSAHIASLITSMARRSLKGTEEMVGAQIAAQVIAGVSTQISIGTTIAQASGALALGHFGQAAALFATAGLMQANLIQQQVAQTEARQTQQSIRNIREQMESWR